MTLARQFDEATILGQMKQDTWKSFLHNFEMIKRKGPIVEYPHKHFRSLAIPNPRQYIAWRKAIDMMGEEQFNKIPIEMVSLYDKEVLLIKKLKQIFNGSKNVKLTMASGYFWKNAPDYRRDMINFLVENMRTKDLKINIMTQDANLKSDFKSPHKVCPNIKKVFDRIDLHHIIVENPENQEKSYCFMDFPHSESFFYRLNISFSFKEAESFNCGLKDFLKFLEWQRKLHLFTKTIPSKFNKAINY